MKELKHYLKERLASVDREDGEVCVLVDELLRLEKSQEVHSNSTCTGGLGPAEDRDPPCTGVALHPNHNTGLRTDERNDIIIAARKTYCCQNCFTSRPPPALTHWARPGCLPRKTYSKKGGLNV